jgi:hypothetical protein
MTDQPDPCLFVACPDEAQTSPHWALRLIGHAFIGLVLAGCFVIGFGIGLSLR